jgi:hypothetical protein
MAAEHEPDASAAGDPDLVLASYYIKLEGMPLRYTLGKDCATD